MSYIQNLKTFTVLFFLRKFYLRYALKILAVWSDNFEFIKYGIAVNTAFIVFIFWNFVHIYFSAHLYFLKLVLCFYIFLNWTVLLSSLALDWSNCSEAFDWRNLHPSVSDWLGRTACQASDWRRKKWSAASSCALKLTRQMSC